MEDEDLLVKKVVDSWNELGMSLATKAKDEIAVNYLRHIIGADEKTIRNFIKGDLSAGYKIGMCHAGIDLRKGDTEKFWDIVLPLLPHKYTIKEKEVIRNDRALFGVISFMARIGPYPYEGSEILRKINVNMHVYK